jgi:large subunit ribosomal protein L18
MRTLHRRKREGKTNYGKRLDLLVSRKPRAVIRKSLKGFIVQIVRYTPNGDTILAAAYARDLKKFGLEKINANIPTAYLTGLLCGIRAKKAGITDAIVDLGLQKSHKKGRLYAAVKGLLDAGLTIPCDESVLPEDAKILGEHISAYDKSAGAIPVDTIKNAILQ